MQQELTITVTNVTLIRNRQRADRVVIHTYFPSPCPKLSDQALSVDFEVAQGDGYRYLIESIGIKPELIEIIDIKRDHFA